MAKQLYGLSHERLLQIFHYDPDTGDFTRKCSSRRSRAGTIAGSVNKLGYIVLSPGRHRGLAHRFAWFYMTGEVPEHPIDHANLNRADNRWANLRAATQSKNMANAPKRSTNRSGFKGVSFDAAKGRWLAGITHNYRNHYLGRYDDKTEAGRAYDAAAKRLFGEFAKLNFPS